MGLTAVEVLLDLHRDYPEVFGQIEIYADGGVRHASHILTLISLGVTAVGVGRPFYFANIFGQDGISKLIDIFNTELDSTMQLMGEDNIESYRGNASFVSQRYLRESFPTIKLTLRFQVNTKKIELDYYGAPLPNDLDTSVYSIPAPLD
jgi:isopentenyl diphosphate isomerase/L-lactate dehydrogenase-like FMN-dependent dehydrogenase